MLPADTIFNRNEEGYFSAYTVIDSYEFDEEFEENGFNFEVRVFFPTLATAMKSLIETPADEFYIIKVNLKPSEDTTFLYFDANTGIPDGYGAVYSCSDGEMVMGCNLKDVIDKVDYDYYTNNHICRYTCQCDRYPDEDGDYILNRVFKGEVDLENNPNPKDIDGLKFAVIV